MKNVQICEFEIIVLLGWLLIIHQAEYFKCSVNMKEYSLATEAPLIHVLSAE